MEKASPAALIQKAREAQKARQWAEAEALWRSTVAAAPGDAAARAGLGSVLLARGDTAGALTVAKALLADFARDPAGHSLAAQVAAAEERWNDAAEHWREALARKPNLGAAQIGLANALIAFGAFDRAKAYADELGRLSPGNQMSVVLNARVVTARDGDEAGLEAWRSAAALFPAEKSIRREIVRLLLDLDRADEAEAHANALLTTDREEGLMQLGNVLARRETEADHTDFWKRARTEFPWNHTFLRRHAMSAMRAGRRDDAIAAMDTLLRSGDLLLQDAGLVVGLAHIHAARGDLAALHAAVRTYMRALKGSAHYRLAALKLSRIAFAWFAKHDTKRRLTPRQRTQRMIARSPLKPKARALLERSLALEDAIAARTTAWFDTDVSRRECEAFVTHVRERAAKREPFSFVRINDGESSAFAYEPELAVHYAADAAEREHVWWGRAVSADERAHMAQQVAEATWHADAIGIPNFARILRDVHLAKDDDLSHSRTGRGLRTDLGAFERWSEFRAADLPPPVFTSANLHQDLQRWNLYGALFDGAGELVLVSCHPDLPDVMAAQFGTRVAANIVVPPRHLTIPLLSKRADTPKILPEVIDEVIARVREAAPGRMVVVGAGYLGKWIVHQAKLTGGVALDLGSALDYWMGLKTRSYQDLA